MINIYYIIFTLVFINCTLSPLIQSVKEGAGGVKKPLTQKKRTSIKLVTFVKATLDNFVNNVKLLKCVKQSGNVFAVNRNMWRIYFLLDIFIPSKILNLQKF